MTRLTDSLSMIVGLLIGVGFIFLSLLPVEKQTSVIPVNSNLEEIPIEVRTALQDASIEIEIPIWMWSGRQESLRISTEMDPGAEMDWNYLIEAQLSLPQAEVQPQGAITMPLAGAGMKEINWMLRGSDPMEGVLWLHLIALQPGENQARIRLPVLARQIEIPVRNILPGLAMLPMRWLGAGLVVINSMWAVVRRLMKGSRVEVQPSEW